MVSDPAGNSVKADTGYALKLVPATMQRNLANGRAERRVFLGAGDLVQRVGGAPCWAAKLRDDEEDPLKPAGTHHAVARECRDPRYTASRGAGQPGLRTWHPSVSSRGGEEWCSRLGFGGSGK